MQKMLDKWGAEDVRQIPAGCGQDKQGVEHVRQVPGGHVDRDKHGCRTC